MNACACMHRECVYAGFCIAQYPDRPIAGGTLPRYWENQTVCIELAEKPDDPGWCRHCDKADHTDADCWSTRVVW